MNRAPASPLGERAAQRFEREIQKAITAGAGADELTLRLTLMDASKIKRDPAVATSDISFSPQGMRFMGVRVVEGGVRSSELLSGPLPEDEAPPVVEAKPRKKSVKAVRKPKAAAETSAAAEGGA